MVEGEGAGEAAGKGLGALKQKVGPLPLIVWIAILGGMWWYLKRRQAGSKTGAQTDPAGNVGTINPKTGYVYGSSQDQSALGAQDSGGLTGSTSSSASGSTVAGQYADNNAWARAAINYLVGIGIDPVAANSAVEQYISSQALTPDQQGDVNLAIQSIGAPPQPPQPGTAPSPVVLPPSPGPVYAANPPTGLSVTSTTSSTAALVWNRASNAKGYSVTWRAGSEPSQTLTVTGTDTTATVAGLQPATTYQIQVQATPARPGDGFASTTVTTPGAPSTTPPVQPPGGGAAIIPARTVTVVAWKPPPNTPWDSTLSGIAAHEGVSLSALEAANPQITNPNLIYPGQQIKIPS